jgi:hypothetical protein
MVWAWLERGKRRRRSGEAGEASIGRARAALLGARVLHVLRGAHLLVPGRPGEARDRVFGAVGESLRVGGHDLGAASPKNEVLRSDQKVSYLDHFSLQHIGCRVELSR